MHTCVCVCVCVCVLLVGSFSGLFLPLWNASHSRQKTLNPLLLFEVGLLLSLAFRLSSRQGKQLLLSSSVHLGSGLQSGSFTAVLIDTAIALRGAALQITHLPLARDCCFVIWLDQREEALFFCRVVVVDDDDAKVIEDDDYCCVLPFKIIFLSSFPPPPTLFFFIFFSSFFTFLSPLLLLLLLLLLHHYHLLHLLFLPFLFSCYD